MTDAALRPRDAPFATLAGRPFTLWIAFILVHFLLGALALFGPGYPLGDVDVGLQVLGRARPGIRTMGRVADLVGLSDRRPGADGHRVRLRTGPLHEHLVEPGHAGGCRGLRRRDRVRA